MNIITDNNNGGKFNTILNKTVRDLLIKREIGPKQFSKLVFEALSDESMTDRRRRTHRQNLKSMVLGNLKLTYDKFEFIMNDVLKEPIPDDPEILHLSRLGSRGIDILGRKFGRLTVIECLGSDNNKNKLFWRCKCDCDNEVAVRGCGLKNGSTKSCGCYNYDIHTIHGKSNSREWRSWRSMKARCINKNSPDYKDYGGRGITVCERWLKFENFYKDMGDRPEGMTLDRRDNDGNYCKENCRWATDYEQRSNKKNTLKFDDGTSVVNWARENNLKYWNVRKDFHNGKNKSDILM